MSEACVIALTCAPGSGQQREALVRLIRAQHPEMSEATATACAMRILKEHGLFRTIPKIVREFAT